MKILIIFISTVLGLLIFGATESRAHNLTSQAMITSLQSTGCYSVRVSWNRGTPSGSVLNQYVAGHYNDGTTNYQYQSGAIGASTTSFIANGLLNNEPYWFQVGSLNADGHITWSSTSGPVTPQCVYSSFYPAFYPSAYSSFYPGFYPGFYPSAYSTFYPAFYPSFYPTFYPSFYPSFSPCVPGNPSAPNLISPANFATGQPINGLVLDWSDVTNWGTECTSGTRTYRLYFTQGSANPIPIYATNLNTSNSSYALPTLSPNTMYQWQVGAVNASNRENKSNVFQFTTGAVPGPFTLNSTAVSQTQINLSWTASANAVTYEIRRNGNLIGSQAASNPRTLNDTGLSCNTSYNYQVRAINALGQQDSNVSSAVTFVCSPGPFTLSATPFSQSQINLSWTASTNAVNYEIYRDGFLVTTVGSATLSYPDTGRVCGTAYSYQIKATNASTPPTTDSNIANTSTLACTPPYPGIVTLDAATEICVNDSPAYEIEWSDTIASPNAPADSYIVEVTKVSTGQRYTRTVGGSVFSLTWSSLNQLALTPPGTTFNYSPEPSTSYSFKVTAVKTGFLNGVSGTLADVSSTSCSSCAVNPPVAFNNLAPVDGSIAPYRPDFSWTSAWPSGNSGDSSYVLKLTPQGQSQLPDVTTTNTYLTWDEVFAVWSGQPFLAGEDFLPVGVVYNWVVVADNQCTGTQTSASTSFTAQNLSAWLQTVGGSVESSAAIEQDFARPDGLFNATGLVVSSSTVSNFNSQSGWLSANSNNTPNPQSYSSLKSLFVSRATPTATIMPNGGVHIISGDQTVNSSFSVPTEPTVLIVEGDLTINTDINLPNESDENAALILIVDGDINVDSSVTQIDAFMVTGGNFVSRAGLPSSSFSEQLNVLGGLVYYSGASFNRIIDPIVNPDNDTPAEKFTYDPRIIYLFSSESILGVSRTTWQELVP